MDTLIILRILLKPHCIPKFEPDLSAPNAQAGAEGAGIEQKGTFCKDLTHRVEWPPLGKVACIIALKGAVFRIVLS